MFKIWGERAAARRREVMRHGFPGLAALQRFIGGLHKKYFHMAIITSGAALDKSGYK